MHHRQESNQCESPTMTILALLARQQSSVQQQEVQEVLDEEAKNVNFDTIVVKPQKMQRITDETEEEEELKQPETKQGPPQPNASMNLQLEDSSFNYGAADADGKPRIQLVNDGSIAEPMNESQQHVTMEPPSINQTFIAAQSTIPNGSKTNEDPILPPI